MKGAILDRFGGVRAPLSLLCLPPLKLPNFRDMAPGRESLQSVPFGISFLVFLTAKPCRESASSYENRSFVPLALARRLHPLVACVVAGRTAGAAQVANPDGTVHAAAKKSWFAVKTL